jgi:hypothetical protein
MRLEFSLLWGWDLEGIAHFPPFLCRAVVQLTKIFLTSEAFSKSLTLDATLSRKNAVYNFMFFCGSFQYYSQNYL